MAKVKYIGMYDIFGQSPYIHKLDEDQSKLMHISADTKIPKYVNGEESADKNQEQSDGN